MRAIEHAPMWLASRSPRRLDLLREAGVDVQVQPSDIDDGQLRGGHVSAEAWVMALAFLKARRVRDLLAAQQAPDGGTQRWARRVILAADTVCAHRGVIHGQPKDADHARGMLKAMRKDAHQTLTGVCLLDMQSHKRLIACDAATVQLGAISDAMIDQYIESGQWQGKAGGYNYADRLHAGWPLLCDGDPTTVMGLPMQRLPDLYTEFAALCANGEPRTNLAERRTM